MDDMCLAKTYHIENCALHVMNELPYASELDGKVQWISVLTLSDIAKTRKENLIDLYEQFRIDLMRIHFRRNDTEEVLTNALRWLL